jgi:Uma2 family endonuclease
MSTSAAIQSTLETEVVSSTSTQTSDGSVMQPKSPPVATPSVEPRPVRWTREQYHKMGELGWFANKRVELIEGDILEMSPIGDRHWIAVNLVNEALRRVFQTGFIISAQSSLRLSDTSEPEPDIAVIRGNLRQLNAVPDTAELVVEVSDTTLLRARTAKASLYARADIPEYWIVDLVHNQLIVQRRPQMMDDQPFGFGYASTEVLNSSETVCPLAAAGTSILVMDLLP